jgi:hypothetical protein
VLILCHEDGPDLVRLVNRTIPGGALTAVGQGVLRRDRLGARDISGSARLVVQLLHRWTSGVCSLALGADTTPASSVFGVRFLALSSGHLLVSERTVLSLLPLLGQPRHEREKSHGSGRAYLSVFM